VAGPTASGKTALAVELAKGLGGEVISCDSMQIYRHMDIGTAKPTREEMQGIPHHMIDVADPAEEFSVSRYCQMATPILEDILARGKIAVIAGGTGLYMDSLIRGNDFAPFPATGRRQELEEQADREGMAEMLTWLRSVDPETGDKLHMADRKRIIRALEVYLETGIPISEHNRRTQAVPPKFQASWLGLTFADRTQLYRRIDLRVELMLRQGLLKEIRDLLDRGVPRSCTAMQAIGYKEFLDALDGKCPLEEAVAQVQQSSRRYAKRQLTWFRRNEKIHWLVRRAGEPGDAILTMARQVLGECDN
jgi:tRNA dimethylallyltransferase